MVVHSQRAFEKYSCMHLNWRIYGSFEKRWIEFILRNKTIRKIKNSLRKTDIITRYGGDEFLITLDIEKAKDVERILERINRSFEKYNRYSNKKYELSVTFGHGTYSKNYETLEKFISVIDNKMYENKRIKKVVFE